MTPRFKALLILLAIAPALSGCLAAVATGAVVGTTVGVTGAVVGTGVAATGAVVGAVIPDSDKDKKAKKDKKNKKKKD